MRYMDLESDGMITVYDLADDGRVIATYEGLDVYRLVSGLCSILGIDGNSSSATILREAQDMANRAKPEPEY